MVVFKRKQVVIMIIFCMILAAGYINWAYQSDGDTAAVSNEEKYLGEAEMVNAPPEKSFFDSASEAKTTTRNKAIELLNEIVNNPSTDEASKTSALAQLAQMADNMEKEGICEGILNSKGMGEMVVYIADGVATVTVNRDGELTGDDVAKISDVILSNTKVGAENIKVSKVQ